MCGISQIILMGNWIQSYWEPLGDSVENAPGLPLNGEEIGYLYTNSQQAMAKDAPRIINSPVLVAFLCVWAWHALGFPESSFQLIEENAEGIWAKLESFCLNHPRETNEKVSKSSKCHMNIAHQSKHMKNKT